ncbi:MAG: FecR domain-containing protein [Opitutus sp.]
MGILSLVFLTAPTLQAQIRKRSPASKVYFTDVSGDASINTGEQISDVTKRSVYAAQGSVIETRPAAAEGGGGRGSSSSVVFSNGTGAYLDRDTRVEMRRFEQEPFMPQRTDMDTEPSISQTQAFVERGKVGLSTSKLVAGTNMTYETPLGTIKILGGKVVIETDSEMTKISVLEGECVVRGGPQDMGGHTVKAGEQAVILRGDRGRPNIVRILLIPPLELPQLEEIVAMASLAKRTVYFEERIVDVNTPVDAIDSGVVTAFDEAAGAETNSPVREIVPIEIVPRDLPVQFTISPAQILSPGSNPSGG